VKDIVEAIFSSYSGGKVLHGSRSAGKLENSSFVATYGACEAWCTRVVAVSAAGSGKELSVISGTCRKPTIWQLLIVTDHERVRLVFLHFMRIHAAATARTSVNTAVMISDFSTVQRLVLVMKSSETASGAKPDMRIGGSRDGVTR
jgi:hypothetical protein